jgi:hypothetical protein
VIASEESGRASDDASPFRQHDLDRRRVLAAIANLERASVFGPVPQHVKDLTLRFFYLKADVVTMTHILLQLDEVLAESVRTLEGDGAPPAAIVKRWRAASDEVFPKIDRLAVAYKALFFFLRAFQDVAYSLLLELNGQRSGDGTSMKDCFAPKKEGRPSLNPVRADILESLPGYEAWFRWFRDLRNDFKRGRGHGSSTDGGRIRVGVDLQRGNVSDRRALIGLSDVATSLEMSAGLFGIMKRRAAAAMAR